MRRTIVVGNWKMFKTESETVEFINKLTKIKGTFDWSVIDAGIAGAFTNLVPLISAISNNQLALKVGAQNCYFKDEGAFTGEVSVPMLEAIGTHYVIIGHSERRNIFGETDEMVNQKLTRVLKSALSPILCIGENLDQHNKGETLTVITNQLMAAFKGIDPQLVYDRIDQVVIAYEPIWAIGTGKTATPKWAQDVCHVIRDIILEKVFPNYANIKAIAENIRVQYGGSVKPENIKSFIAKPDIDGALVGGASLQPASFLALLKESCQNQKQ